MTKSVIKIIKLNPIIELGHLLKVTFNDGKSFIIDLYPTIYKYNSLQSLLDRNEFKKVKIEDGGLSIEWANGLPFNAQVLRKIGEEQQKTFVKALNKVVNG